MPRRRPEAQEVPVRNPAELAARLSLDGVERVLLVDPPEALARLLADRQNPATIIEARAIRSIKETFDAIVVWRESRIGSRALFDAVLKRLAPGAPLWIVIALKKVKGLKTPSVHRLELGDLVKALSGSGLRPEGEVRVSAWHVGYRFAKGGSESSKGNPASRVSS